MFNHTSSSKLPLFFLKPVHKCSFKAIYCSENWAPVAWLLQYVWNYRFRVASCWQLRLQITQFNSPPPNTTKTLHFFFFLNFRLQSFQSLQGRPLFKPEQISGLAGQANVRMGDLTINPELLSAVASESNTSGKVLDCSWFFYCSAIDLLCGSLNLSVLFHLSHPLHWEASQAVIQ